MGEWQLVTIGIITMTLNNVRSVTLIYSDDDTTTGTVSRGYRERDSIHFIPLLNIILEIRCLLRR